MRITVRGIVGWYFNLIIGEMDKILFTFSFYGGQ
jgi:hypothetical protein